MIKTDEPELLSSSHTVDFDRNGDRQLSDPEGLAYGSSFGSLIVASRPNHILSRK
jgi:hypothetical protein